MKKKLTTAGHLLSLFGLLLAVLLLFAQNWLFKSWESLSADEVIYHTKVSLGGTNPGMIAELAFQYLLPGLLVFAVLAFMAFWLKKKESPLRRMIYKLYFLLALIPFVWYAVTLNHSSVHSYFTCRDLGVSMMAVLFGLTEIHHNSIEKEKPNG